MQQLLWGKLLEAVLTDGGQADGKGCAEAVLTIDDADVTLLIC